MLCAAAGAGRIKIAMAAARSAGAKSLFLNGKWARTA
jgi:hypothetical protein